MYAFGISGQTLSSCHNLAKAFPLESSLGGGLAMAGIAYAVLRALSLELVPRVVSELTSFSSEMK